MGGIASSQLGKINFQEKEIINFPKGIIGFSEKKNYLLLEPEECKPFKWLQSIDDSNLAFVLIDPFVFFPDYQIKPSPEDLTELEQNNLKQLKIYVIVTLSPDPSQTSANLIAPLIFNFKKNLGRQIVLTKSPYTIRHFLLK
jgi:flagellar assembly factor FliW